jgi:predicted enzyme related to lactoylglutathione lyase
MHPPPPIVQQITWVYTYDLDRTARFYGELLALPMVLDQGSCRVFRTSATSFIGVCQRPDRDVEPRGVILTLLTPDIAGWHARLTAAGADVVGPPAYSERYRAHAFVCRDPEGYRIELQWFSDPRWELPEGSPGG